MRACQNKGYAFGVKAVACKIVGPSVYVCYVSIGVYTFFEHRFWGTLFVPFPRNVCVVDKVTLEFIS